LLNMSVIICNKCMAVRASVTISFPNEATI
jgi:hypothetical protein